MYFYTFCLGASDGLSVLIYIILSDTLGVGRATCLAGETGGAGQRRQARRGQDQAARLPITKFTVEREIHPDIASCSCAHCDKLSVSNEKKNGLK